MNEILLLDIMFFLSGYTNLLYVRRLVKDLEGSDCNKRKLSYFSIVKLFFILPSTINSASKIQMSRGPTALERGDKRSSVKKAHLVVCQKI